MKPSLPDLARDLAARLRTDIATQLTGFRAGNVAMTAAIIDMIGEHWDDAAARLYDENSAFRALLARGDAPVAEPAMDLRISALEAENERLRAALIDLHVAAEAADDDDARALERDIWDELARSVARRRTTLANF